ncbi:hypothetical protein BKA57DRAFT_433686 [Linnemannia elongata]|nr:hypothetical protein BKA57DRAFT_433686 [Linnemannia elongata]
MDLTLAEETTVTTSTVFSLASSSSSSSSSSASSLQEQQDQQPAESAAGSASTAMDFFFHGALDQLHGATELDIQLNPLLMNRVTQLCLAKISIASSGRESLRRVAQLSCFWRRLQSDMFFMPLQSAPQTTTSLDPSNMFATPTSEPFAIWNWLQDTTGLELDYFNLGNEANMTSTGTTGYTTLLSDPSSDLSSPSFSSVVSPSSSPLTSGQPLPSPSSEFPITSANLYTNNSNENNSMDYSSTSATTASIMAYTDLSGCNSTSSSSMQTCQPMVSSAALAVSDALAFQLASFQSPSVTPISDAIGNSTSAVSSSPFTISTAAEASASGRVESFIQGPEGRQESLSSQPTSPQSSLPSQSHEEKFSMSNDVSSQNEMVSSPEKTEMDVDKSPCAEASNNHNHQQHRIDIDDSLSGHHATVPMAAFSEQGGVDHADDSQDVSDMDVDRAIQEMALHSAPSSPSKGHHYDTRQQRSARFATSPSAEDTESVFPSDASSPSLPASFTARLVSVLQDEDLEMEEEELELHRIKRRRCSEDSSSSDSGPESAPTSPRTPPSNLEGSQSGVAPLHSENCLPHAAVPGLSARRLYNLHPDGDEHGTGSRNGGSANPFLSSPMTDYVLQDSGMMSKDQHHRFLASASGSNSISTATGAATAATATATSTTGHGGAIMAGVAGGAGSVAVVVVEDLLNLNRQEEGEGQVGILATTVHTRYPTRSTTQRRVI